ncbi:hypothetical protein V6N12_029826 [Hibiscus sabdariffa]|uniref:Uncharacterized protein n=1 Tax=Hibiscus sabdariffa TaxID=183260 RepID=A0ABR2CX93_9ROSI
MVFSEEEKSDGATPRVLRENPVFIPSGQDYAASMVAWDECIGMLDRGMGSGSERFDAMWCDSALARQEDAHVLLGFPVMLELGGAGVAGHVGVGRCGDKEDTLNTILSYSETDLIPVPVKSAVVEKGVEVVVADGVARKVSSVNDLVLNMRSEEQKCLLVKAMGKSRQNKARTAVADGDFFLVIILFQILISSHDKQQF